MMLTDQQKRQHYVTALHRFNPTVYTLSALAKAPTANLRALCVVHQLDPACMDRGEPTPWTISTAHLLEALEWYAGQGRSAAPDLDAWMPPSFLKEPMRPFTPPPIRALTAGEEAWLPVPFLKPKG